MVGILGACSLGVVITACGDIMAVIGVMAGEVITVGIQRRLTIQVVLPLEIIALQDSLVLDLHTRVIKTQ
jgi:hypothetical protein